MNAGKIESWIGCILDARKALADPVDPAMTEFAQSLIDKAETALVAHPVELAAAHARLMLRTDAEGRARFACIESLQPKRSVIRF